MNKNVAKAIVSMSLAFLCACSSAQDRARVVNYPSQAWGVSRLNEKSSDDHWQVWESNGGELDGGCAFHIKYSRKGVLELEKTIEVSDCGMTVSTNYRLLPNRVLLADWQSERNGLAFLFRPVQQDFQWIELPYKSTEDGSLAVTVEGTKIFFLTPVDRFAVEAQADGGFVIDRRQ